MDTIKSNETIGRSIYDLRKKANLTQEELADKLYVSRQAVSNWERNINVPDRPILEQICNLFGVKVDDFVKDKLKMEKENKYKYNKFDTAIGLFYATSLFIGALVAIIMGIIFNTLFMWIISVGIGLCTFLVLGLLSHGIITLKRNDEENILLYTCKEDFKK